MSFDQQQQQQQVGAGAGAGKGFESVVVVRDEASCIVQQESSGESGSTLKAHDYIGLSEVTSMPLKMSSPNVPDLNLGETELRLGPPKSSPKDKNSSEAPKGESQQLNHKSDAKNSKNNEAAADLQPPQQQNNSNVFSWPPRMIQQQQENASEMSPFGSSNVVQQKSNNKRGFSEAIASSGNGFVEGRSVIPPPPAATNPSSAPANPQNSNNNNGKNPLMASPMYPWSNNNNNNSNKQQLPAAWRMGLEQSKGSFGPFPSSRIQHNDNNAATNKNNSTNNANNSNGSSPNSSALTSNSVHKEDPHDEIAPSASPPVVGWPPVQSFRKNTLAAHPAPQPPQHKSSSSSPASVAGGETKISAPQSAAANAANPSTAPAAGAAASASSSPLFVKVYMDGVPIGRKVDLKANNSYEKLSSVLEDMFHRFISGQNGGPEVSSSSAGAEKKLNFLQSSDFVLTYEDKDGDLMLVGDVPWGMFTGTVKRLRIMKGSEAIGLAPRDKAACQA